MSNNYKSAALALVAVLGLSACTSYQDPVAEPAVTGAATPTAAAPASPADAASPSDDASATGDDADDQGSASVEPEATSAATVTPDTVSPASTTDVATWDVPTALEDAIKTAKGAASGTMHEIELENSSHYKAWVYKVSFQDGRTENKIIIDAVSGDIIANEKDTDDDDDDKERAVDVDEMSPAEAMAKAQRVLDGTVAEWSLDWDDNVQAYSVEIRQGNDTEDVKVETKSGKAYRD